MPEKQNNESDIPERDRISFFRVLLFFGPHVGAVIAIVLSVITLYKLSVVSNLTRENAETMKGVIMQQSDLSEEVYGLEEKIAEFEGRLEVAVISNETIKSEIENLHPELLSNRGADEWPKAVYLTFDDGPSPNTAEILDILKEYNVKATFFTVGKESEEYKQLYNRILDEGHTLGMHSYSHVYKEIYASSEAFENDLNKISSYMEEVTGVKPRFYRFPGGSNNVQIGSKFAQFKDILDNNGITYFDWNISTKDATNPARSAEEITANALDGIEKYETVVILMHDLGNKDTTVEALPAIIENLLNEGIPIKPITESTKVIQYQ